MRLGRPDRAAAALLALAVLLGAMPLTLGVTLERNHGPVFALNICHPPQGCDRSPVTVIAVMPQPPVMRAWLPQCAPAEASEQAPRLREADAPDPPPPKTRA